VIDMTHVEELVSRQVVLSELKKRLEKEGQREAPVRVEDVAYGPCLLVSRQWGSQGQEVAQLVGHRLGWWVYDREIVEEIAQRSHLRRKLIEAVDEQVRSKFSRSLGRLAYGAGSMDDQYLFYLRQVILALGHHGDVVIMGRGAQFLLPPRAAVRVRVVAPLETRVRRLAQREGVSSAEAKRRIEDRDAKREEFIRHVFSADARSPFAYDLVLNTEEISVEAAAGIVLTALSQKLGVNPKDSSQTVETETREAHATL
jgi:cytidylate kinase